MARHIFMFNGGDDLTTMGATWFVSYCYYKNIDSTHDNWKTVKTCKNRISVYNSTINNHKYWLNKVLQMDENNLNKNTLGLRGKQVVKMADELLQVLP